ncbi:Ubiquitin supergroup, partial [Cynara cardunculus var. scolymus]
MERAISNLAFRGSILEAITEAKRQKKLFVVYISGDDEVSASMDESTWSESNPQKPAPCITAIGYNGVQLWQNEGFVSAEVLVSTLEKAWLSLHETTASFLTAALASRQSEQIPSEAAPTTAREIGSSSSTPSSNTNASASEINSKLGDDDVSHGPFVNKLEESKVEQLDTTTREPVKQVTTSASDSRVDKKSSLNVVEAPQVVDTEAKPKKSESSQTEKDDYSDLASNRSTDIHLNIRLPGGTSLQEKFEPTSTLRMVKDCVDQKQETSISSYDLAIPYPRKVFGDQDLSKTLKELSLLDRQALIVVPHLRGAGHHKGRSSTPNPSVSTSAAGSSDGEGLYSLVKRVLSYVNPLAYLGAGGAAANSSTSAPETRRSLPESGTFTGSRSYVVRSNQSDITPSTGRNNRPNSSRFGSGSNIHTLKHDEDDSKFSGKNAFWNGNSTEYGGDGDN